MKIRPNGRRRKSRLDALADRFGIEASYRDASGKIRKTSEETKRLLLSAVGVDSSSDAAIAEAIQRMERGAWDRMLEPAYVVSMDHAQPVAIELSLPLERSATTQQAGTIDWILHLEEGGKKQGQAEVQSLPLAEEHEFDGRRFERRRLSLGGDIPAGYHRLKINGGSAETLVIATPGRCWVPASMNEGRRLWGVSAQLYLLRSEANWGIGDFGELRSFVEGLAKSGADVVGLNPLHAMFLDNPEHASPYSPASRLFLNVLYIDVSAAPDFADCKDAMRLIESPEFQKKLQKCRSSELVDYTHITELKLPVLRLLFRHWNSSASVDRNSFETFRQQRGEALERSGVFHALRQKFASQDPPLRDWRLWPEEYRRPDSPEVAAFAIEHRDEVTFMAWMEWVADLQLASAATAAKAMEIGLYRDMAVGADIAGVETWANQSAIVSGAHVGAPPDIFNPAGQDWGLPPFSPRALQEEGYRGFIELIRANMRYAGALRIDHVMALQHLYWVPESRSPREGAYVSYPIEDLVGILALESHRNRCMVVGEDLGTVPDGFRERMANANILSYRVLFFEQNAKTGAFRKPEAYPKLSVAVASNHDLPTIRAWWEGSDISLRERLQLFPDPHGADKQQTQRARDRSQLLRALRQQGLLGKNEEPSPDALVPLVHAFLARSCSFLALAQVDDIAGEIDPVNLPGSLDYPNWRRRLSVTIAELFEGSKIDGVAEIFAQERREPADRSESAAG
jgi:4-alpha-glucanotransferase